MYGDLQVGAWHVRWKPPNLTGPDWTTPTHDASRSLGCALCVVYPDVSRSNGNVPSVVSCVVCWFRQCESFWWCSWSQACASPVVGDLCPCSDHWCLTNVYFAWFERGLCISYRAPAMFWPKSHLTTILHMARGLAGVCKEAYVTARWLSCLPLSWARLKRPPWHVLQRTRGREILMVVEPVWDVFLTEGSMMVARPGPAPLLTLRWHLLGFNFWVKDTA